MYEGKVKSFSLAYNRRETREKRPLAKDPDTSWCHLHTSVQLFWSQTMAPRTLAAAYECAAIQWTDKENRIVVISLHKFERERAHIF